MTAVFINEIHYDTAGTDVNEGFEIAGPAGTDLTGWTVLFYNGNGGAVYDTVALSGTIANQSNGMGAIFFARAGIQNGAPDGFALVNASGTVVQFLSYEGSFTAVGGAANGMVSTDIGVSENGAVAGTSLQLSGSGREYEDFTWAASATSTYNGVNGAQTFTALPIDGTPGDDTLIGTTGEDTINGLDGNDNLRALEGNDILNGGAGDDVLQGYQDDDILNGGDGNDVLSGGVGADTMTGGLGDDLYVIENAGDVVVENAGEGIDEVRSTLSVDLSSGMLTEIENVRLQGTASVANGNAYNNSMFGNASDNQLFGLDGDDVLRGGAGNDGVEGGVGNDTLRGDDGDDFINGGAGRDIMFGGAGADDFYFSAADYSGTTLGTADWIRDFSQADGDTIQIELNGGAFIGDLAFTQSGNAEVRFQVQGTNTMIYIDSNGDAIADAAIRLTGVFDLTSTDITFVSGG